MSADELHTYRQGRVEVCDAHLGEGAPFSAGVCLRIARDTWGRGSYNGSIVHLDDQQVTQLIVALEKQKDAITAERRLLEAAAQAEAERAALEQAERVVKVHATFALTDGNGESYEAVEMGDGTFRVRGVYPASEIVQFLDCGIVDRGDAIRAAAQWARVEL